MAEEKTVVKKTAPRQAVTKKTAASRQTASRAKETSKETTPAKATTSPATKGRARKTISQTTPSPLQAPSVSSSSASSSQDLLYQLATASEEHRLAMIREAAYYKAEKRQFAPGHELEDWAEAEREIDELIARAKAMLGL